MLSINGIQSLACLRFSIRTMISIIGLAAKPGTEVLPICSIPKAELPINDNIFFFLPLIYKRPLWIIILDNNRTFLNEIFREFYHIVDRLYIILTLFSQDAAFYQHSCANQCFVLQCIDSNKEPVPNFLYFFLYAIINLLIFFVR